MWIFSFILQIQFQRKIFTLMLFNFLCEPFSKGIVFRRIRWPWVLERFMGLGTRASSWDCAGLSKNVNFASLSPPSVVSLHSMEETRNSFQGLYASKHTELGLPIRTHPIYKIIFFHTHWAYWRITMASRQTSEEKHYFPAHFIWLIRASNY